MDSDELDIAINELETRVERLRALYEQYFLGIERLEPTVPRKDVDRRIWQLRREKIRNTAKRFRLQTIIQRYNTFQQYWQRICREIERGTYRRHVLKAERATTTVSDIVAQRDAEQRQASVEASRTTADELADMLARDVDAEQEFARAVAEAVAPVAARPKPRGRQPSVDELDLELEGLPRTSTPPAAAPTPEAPRRGNLLAALGARSPGTSRPGAGGLTGPAPLRRRQRATNAGAAEARSTTSAEGSAPAARPAPQAMAARTAVRPTGSGAGLSDQRIAELHRELVAAKQRNREGGKVSVNGLAKSLRAAEAKLKKQHKDRTIDFDIIVKNGKAVVKPIVR